MFVQIIKSPVRDAAGMRRHFFDGVERLHPTAVGWLGATSGVTADDVWINVICFESPEAAARNSERPEQGQWWNEGERYRDGDAAFTDGTDVTILNGGPAPAPGFVRLVEAPVTDRPRVEAVLAGAERGLAIWHDDSVTVVRTHPARPDTDPLVDELRALSATVQVHDIAEPWSA